MMNAWRRDVHGLFLRLLPGRICKSMERYRYIIIARGTPMYGVDTIDCGTILTPCAKSHRIVHNHGIIASLRQLSGEARGVVLLEGGDRGREFLLESCLRRSEVADAGGYRCCARTERLGYRLGRIDESGLCLSWREEIVEAEVL